MEPFRRRYIIDSSQAVAALRQIDREQQRINENARSGYRKSATEAQRSGSAGAASFQRMGQAAQRWIAGAAALAFTALVAAMAKAGQKASEFRRDLAEINTLGDGSAVALGRMERGIIDIAARVGGGTFPEFTKALYDIRSAGYDGADALEVLEQAARGGVGGVTSVSTAADLLTSTLNAYNLSASESGRVSDKLFATVRAGKTTIPELAASLGKVAPAAAAADVPLEELLAGIATLTASGLSTAESVTRMRGAIQAFIKPTDEAKDLAKQLGLEFNATELRARGFAGIMDDVAQATGGNSEQLAILFSNTEAYEAAVQLAGKQAETFKRNLDNVKGSTGDALRAFNDLKNETEQLSLRLRNRLDSILIKLAEKTLPAYNKALALTVELTKTFDTPAQRLLNILKDLPDADPKIVAELEVQVDQQALRKELEAAQKVLGDNAQLQFLSETQREDILRGSDDLTKSRFLRFNTEEQSLKDLRALQGRIIRSIEDTRIGAQDDFFGRIATSQVVNTYQRQLDAINQVIEARTTLEGVNAALAATEEQLNQIRQGNLPSSAPDPTPDPDPVTPTGTPTKITADDVARAKDVLEAVSRGNQILTQTTERQRTALEDIFQIKDEIKRLDEAAKVLGEQAVADQRALLQERLDKAEAALKRETDLVEKIAVVNRELQKVKPLGLAGDDNSVNALIIAQGVIEGFSERITALQNAFSSGEITKPEYFQRLKVESDAFVESLSKMYQRLKDAGLLTPALEAAFEQAFGKAEQLIDGTEKKTKKLNNTLGNIASTLRSLRNFADVFGDLDDDVARLIDSTADVLDNLQRLGDFRSTIGTEGGPAAGSLSAIAGQALPILGIAGGIASGIASFVSSLDRSNEQNRVEMERLQDALRENARRVSDAVDRLINQTRVGSDVPGAKAQAAQDLFNEFSEEYQRAFDVRLIDPDAFVRFAKSRFREFLNDLEALDIPELDGVDIEALFDSLIQSGVHPIDAINQILDGFQDLPTGIRELIENLSGGIGGFSNTVAGAIDRLRFFTEFLGVSGPEALQQFLDSLLAIEGLSEPLREKLEEILGLDLNTPEGKSRLQEIIETVAGGLAGGASAFLGGLSPDEVEEILRTLQQFTEGGGLAGETTTGEFISRTITEFQAGEWLVIAEEQLYTLQQILGELRGEDTSGTVPLFGGGGPSIDVPDLPRPGVVPLTPSVISRTTNFNVQGPVFQGSLDEQDIAHIERAFSRWIRDISSNPNQTLTGRGL